MHKWKYSTLIWTNRRKLLSYWTDRCKSYLMQPIVYSARFKLCNFGDVAKNQALEKITNCICWMKCKEYIEKLIHKQRYRWDCIFEALLHCKTRLGCQCCFNFHNVISLIALPLYKWCRQNFNRQLSSYSYLWVDSSKEAFLL